MKIQMSTAILSIVTAMGLSSAGAVPASAQAALQHVQYDRYQDQRDGYYPPESPPYRGERRDNYAPYPSRDAYDRDYPCGRERPPSGHQWLRVRGQFILVRERDRMIARVITFD